MKRLLAIALIAGCGSVHASDESGARVRVITIGDNAASNPSLAKSYVSLLVENDDALFPEFAGRDLKSHLGAIDLVRLDRGGDSYRGIAEDPRSLCTCSAGECGSPCIDVGSEDRTLLLIQLGVNDLYNLFLRMVSESALRSSPEGALAIVRSAVHDVVSLAVDDSMFPTPPETLVVNVYDPTDGRGDLVELASTLTPLPPGAEEVTPELVEKIIDGTNAIIREETQAIGGTLVDVHGPFVGHGLHFRESTATDRTYWYRAILDPNLRGAHEIRRALWTALTGEAIDVIPTGLPPSGTLGLPGVPDEGWADRVVAAHIARETPIEGLDPIPNSAQDPSIALGPPLEGLTEVVAIGALNDFILLELEEVATDGAGDDLVVLEYGPLSGGTAEPYRVLVASEANGPFFHLGDAAGERAFDLGEIRMASARWVRIESLVHPIDLPALGSPFYPGPEIRAVGAVYPR